MTNQSQVLQDRDALAQDVMRWLNCNVVDVDDCGDIWVADPMQGHYLTGREREEFFHWLTTN